MEISFYQNFNGRFRTSNFSSESCLKKAEFSVKNLMDGIKPVIVRKLFQQQDITWLVVSFEQFEPSGLQTKEKKMHFFPKTPSPQMSGFR